MQIKNPIRPIVILDGSSKNFTFKVKIRLINIRYDWAEFQEISKLIFEPKLSFLKEIHKNDNFGEFLDFNEFILYMNSLKIEKLSFLCFPFKNDNLGLKMKILKFRGIQPSYDQISGQRLMQHFNGTKITKMNRKKYLSVYPNWNNYFFALYCNI